MVKSVSFLGLCCLFILQRIQAVEFTVTNTAEAARFYTDIGIPYTLTTLNSSTYFIWTTLHQNTPADRKTLEKVSMFVDDNMGGPVAYTINDQIHVSAEYIQNYPGHVRREITGVLYHEMTRIWQWDCNGQVPRAVIEGIADYVRLKAGYAPSHWVKAGQGERWDEVGRGVTARFFNYCVTEEKDCFLAELNKSMRNGYYDSYFVEFLGKSVEQLWAEYKAKYHTNG